MNSKPDTKISINVQSIAQELYKKNVDLLNERRRMEKLMYSVSEAVFAVDNNYKITLVNTALEKKIGIKREDSIGKGVNEVIKLTDYSENLVDIKSLCTEDELDKEGDFILHGKSHRYYVNVKATLIKEAPKDENEIGKTECLVTMIDMTKEKMLDQLKDDFISVASHELKTPMTIIKSYLWMLKNKKGGPLTQKQEEYIEKAIGGTDRLIALVNDMLNVSRIEQGRLDLDIEKIDVRAFLEDIHSEFELKTQEKNLEFVLNVDRSVRDAYADVNKLSEILINLLGNAIKFTNSGKIIITAKKEKDFVRISVRDTGEGIEEKDLNRLFHKFTRLDNSYRTVAERGGTGLGLYITKNLVDKMGGSIEVTSEGIGKGACFSFTIPIKKEEISGLAIQKQPEEILTLA